MHRFVLTNAQWAKIEPLCLGKPTDPGRSGADNRLFLEAVLWIDTVFKRYRDWVKAGVFRRIFDAVSDDPDMEFAMVDATIVKVHRHAQGAKGGLKTRPSASQRAAGPLKSSR
jgi:transposase